MIAGELYDLLDSSANWVRSSFFPNAPKLYLRKIRRTQSDTPEVWLFQPFVQQLQLIGLHR